MLITLYKIGELHFRMLATNGFHVKTKGERFTAACSRCRQNLKFEISRRCLADYVKTLHQKACRTCSTIIFLHSTNQIIDLWRCRWRCRRQILKSLMKDLLLRAHVVVRIPNMKISRRHLGRLRQNIAPKSVLHVQHDYFSSFNQSNHWFVVLSLLLPSLFLKQKKTSVKDTSSC